jgi:hypothetical protein
MYRESSILFTFTVCRVINLLSLFVSYNLWWSFLITKTFSLALWGLFKLNSFTLWSDKDVKAMWCNGSTAGHRVLCIGKTLAGVSNGHLPQCPRGLFFIVLYSFCQNNPQTGFIWTALILSLNCWLTIVTVTVSYIQIKISLQIINNFLLHKWYPNLSQFNILI